MAMLGLAVVLAFICGSTLGGDSGSYLANKNGGSGSGEPGSGRMKTTIQHEQTGKCLTWQGRNGMSLEPCNGRSTQVWTTQTDGDKVAVAGVQQHMKFATHHPVKDDISCLLKSGHDLLLDSCFKCKGYPLVTCKEVKGGMYHHCEIKYWAGSKTSKGGFSCVEPKGMNAFVIVDCDDSDKQTWSVLPCK